MTTTNQVFINSVLRPLMESVDTAGVRWTVREVCEYMNAGFVWIAENRPDAVEAYNPDFDLALGAKQALPTGGFKLFEVPANADGTAIRLVDRKMMDVALPGWRAVAGSTTIKNYVFDEREPDAFEVYPPAASGAAVQIRYAAHPTPITLPTENAIPSAVTGNVPLDDLRLNALREYIFYRCKSKDADFAPGVLAAAQAHLSMALQALGVELKATAATGPRSSDAAAGRGVTTGA